MGNENGIQTEDYIEYRRGLESVVGIELNKIANCNKIDLDYFTICAYALEFLSEKLGDNYQFPIDIDKIVRDLGIEISYQPLNYNGNDRNKRSHKIVGKVIKKKNRYTDQDANIILIDDETVTDEQRYALAHGLAHFLMHIEDEWYSEEYRVMPMLFKQKEEMVADIFALFLLIPMPIFLNEFSYYLGDREVPVKTSEWLKYLSNYAQVPYEDVAIGYQNIRYVLSYIYNIRNNKIKIREKDPEKEMILKRQSEKIIRLLEDEMIEKLFC